MKKWFLASAVVVGIGALSTINQLKSKAPIAEEKAESKTKKTAPVVKTDEQKQDAPSSPIAASSAANAETPPTDPLGRFSNLDVPEPPTSKRLRTETGGAGPARIDIALVQATMPKLRREGTKLTNVSGKIERRGSRFEFAPANSPGPLLLLENLVLERIDSLLDAPDVAGANPSFRVSGAVTEYRGLNYLLLERAQLERTAPAPSPNDAAEKPSNPTNMPKDAPKVSAAPKANAGVAPGP